MNLFKVARAFEQFAAGFNRSRVQFEPGRCLHYDNRQADCDACLGSCPVGALRLEPGGIALDEDLCVACGLCFHRCPTGVFDGDDGVADVLNCAMRVDEEARIELACAGHPDPAEGARKVDAVIRTDGCLAMLGPSAYTGLLAVGVERVGIRLDACAECPIGHVRAEIEKTINMAREFISDADVITTIHSLDGIRWKRRRPVYAAKRPPFSRRDFFRKIAAQDMNLAGGLTPAALAGEKAAPREHRRLLNTLSQVPENHRAAASVKFPQFSASEACTACGLCAATCPTGALRLEKEDGEYQLLFNAQDCTDCGKCLSLCPAQALEHAGYLPLEWEARESAPVVLVSGALRQCARCKTDFAATAGESLCPVCDFRRKNPFGSQMPPHIAASQRKTPQPPT
jgi:ferredoxin